MRRLWSGSQMAAAAMLCCFTQSAAQSDTLTILSWNVQMLPGPVRGGGKLKRAAAILEQLRNNPVDIIVFQELFHQKARKRITKELSTRYSYHTQVLNRKSISLKTNGGVMIFSRFPIQSTRQIRYNTRTGIDRMARKGALLAEVVIEDRNIQIIGTHLQAFGTDSVMMAQYRQLANELLNPHRRSGVPQIICGDLNTLKIMPPGVAITPELQRRLPRFNKMLDILQAVDGPLEGEQQYTMDRPFNDLCEKRKEYRLLLDYVLLRGADDAQVRRRVRIFRQAWHPKHVDLSDHFTLEAKISGF